MRAFFATSAYDGFLSFHCWARISPDNIPLQSFLQEPVAHMGNFDFPGFLLLGIKKHEAPQRFNIRSRS